MLDAEILAEVYIAMTRGQESLLMELTDDSNIGQSHIGERLTISAHHQRVLRANAEEISEHEALLAEIQKESKGKCVWLANLT